MGWPTPAARCEAEASSVGHGLYLCLTCQENTQRDLLRLRRQRITDERRLRHFAEQQAGSKPNYPPIYPARGEVPAGRFEENRGKH